MARPWTPPDLDTESSPRSDYFSDPFRPHSPHVMRVENRWPSRPDTPAHMDTRCDSPSELYKTRPGVVERLTEPAPYTPTKNMECGLANSDRALRYPYTPDSSRMLRRRSEVPSSPVPWGDYSEHSSSPVQNALSSCIAHFENLIQSQQPDEDQLEFIVQQFEAMTSYLSAPESQSRKTDDHLFPELDQPSGAGLGVADMDDARAEHPDYVSREAHEAYSTEVGKYIQGVKRYIEDLKMRLDEVKTLNSIQVDVITDLRRQMRAVGLDMRLKLDMRDHVSMDEDELAKLAVAESSKDLSSAQKEKQFGIDSWVTLVDEDNAEIHSTQTVPESKQDGADKQAANSSPMSRRRLITIVRKPEKGRFWSSIGQALDSFGDLLREE
ncbi:hypothetical protein BDU57DRAFT_450241 [Ampelomyces quisqualis]|uniref:Uncharacterized protein n=1 Tax=Ampelomyces quisqualis TaxID=50730 RepID=A0A6A5QP58_AMPQU|nr:hypothetical protein BDU57DRAFT_450241 [Ampelomyces quisqualis]